MAREINRLIGSRDRFWQRDAFDHLLRHEDQFHYLRRYIAENPMKAHLPPRHFVLYQTPL
jgi:type I restriction enzyme R subunit